MILWLCFVMLLLWTAVFRYRRRRMYQLAALIPSTKEERPVIGVAHTLVGSTEDIMISLQRHSYTCISNNGIMRGWLNHILYFVLTDPTDVEMVLKTCMEKDELHRFIRNVNGNGGIFAPVSIWRRRRKILLPAFSPKLVENFVEVFSEQSEKLTEKLEPHAQNGIFSIWPFISSYSLDSVCESTMGVKINALGDSNSPYLLAMNTVLNLVCERIFHLWLQPDWLYKFFPQWSSHKRCVKELHGFTDQVIQNKREELKKKAPIRTEADYHYDLANYQRQTFLDLLISLSGGAKGYTNIELREEILTLTIAGTDTSAACIGFTLMLLSKFPEVQERVYEELCEVFGDSNRPVDKDDLMKLKYLERVVKESLRLFPPVPFIIRKVLEDVKLPSTGYMLPAGSGVVISIWGIHRDPKYWGDNAEAFDPDRFLPDRFNLTNTCSYMPFSNGPRNCVGYQYALMSIKTALSTMLRRYKVIGKAEEGNVPRIRVKLDVMLKAVDGYEVALERRSKTVVQ